MALCADGDISKRTGEGTCSRDGSMDICMLFRGRIPGRVSPFRGEIMELQEQITRVSL